MNKTTNSVYIVVNSLSLWHSRLGHVNNRRLHDMSVLELIPNCKHDMEGKSKVCAQTKITKTPFPKIKRKISLLELVHSDVCDLYSTPSR